ncbi:MAG: hypothetical protein WBG71_04090 [Leeuwenhoekiella sp.]
MQELENNTNMGILTIKYSVTNLQTEKRRKVRQKTYLVRDINAVEDKLETLGEDLIAEHKESKKSLGAQFWNYLKSFGSRCNQTYYHVLRS